MLSAPVAPDGSSASGDRRATGARTGGSLGTGVMGETSCEKALRGVGVGVVGLRLLLLLPPPPRRDELARRRMLCPMRWRAVVGDVMMVTSGGAPGLAGTPPPLRGVEGVLRLPGIILRATRSNCLLMVGYSTISSMDTCRLAGSTPARPRRGSSLERKLASCAAGMSEPQRSKKAAVWRCSSGTPSAVGSSTLAHAVEMTVWMATVSAAETVRATSEGPVWPGACGSGICFCIDAYCGPVGRMGCMKDMLVSRLTLSHSMRSVSSAKLTGTRCSQNVRPSSTLAVPRIIECTSMSGMSCARDSCTLNLHVADPRWNILGSDGPTTVSSYWCCTTVLKRVQYGHDVHLATMSRKPRFSKGMPEMRCACTAWSRSSGESGDCGKQMRTGTVLLVGPSTPATGWPLLRRTCRPSMSSPKTTSLLPDSVARTMARAALRTVSNVMPMLESEPMGICWVTVRTLVVSGYGLSWATTCVIAAPSKRAFQ